MLNTNLRRLSTWVPVLLTALLPLEIRGDEENNPLAEKTDWGSVTVHPSRAVLDVAQRPADGKLLLPESLPQVVSAFLNGEPSLYLPIEINSDASKISVVAPREGVIAVRTCDTSGQTDLGEILFTAREAEVHGKQAKLESHPGNYRIGFWTNADDYVTWDYQATRWGKYSVALTYSTASPDGTEIEVEMGGEKVAGRLKSTGSWYIYHTVELGDLYLAKVGPQVLTVRCTKKVGGAVMNLKAVILQPICEGTPPVQAEDGSVLLHGRDASIQGTRLRYEPAEKKQTLGYWTNPQDTAVWSYKVNAGGRFDVEVLQGCGAGQGGSSMMLVNFDPNNRTESKPLNFFVEDTGHFQNFRPRVVGQIELTPGEYFLYLRPLEIAKTAACDVRQVRLIPVKGKE